MSENKTKEPKKREWVYVCNPSIYGIACDKCRGANIEWSEFEHLIWCYDCKIDTAGTFGVFDGPIPINAAKFMGMSFDHFDLRTGKVIPIEQIIEAAKHDPS